MNKMLEVNWKPSARILRQFGLIAVAGFGLLALLAWNEALVFSGGLGAARAWVASTFTALALYAGFASLAYPKANLPLYLGLTVLSYPIGMVVSYVVMGVLFYLIIAPIAIVMRVLGRDVLRRRPGAASGSYWVQIRSQADKSSYFRQF